jgi:hypothetical protein
MGVVGEWERWMKGTYWDWLSFVEVTAGKDTGEGHASWRNAYDENS